MAPDVLSRGQSPFSSALHRPWIWFISVWSGSQILIMQIMRDILKLALLSSKLNPVHLLLGVCVIQYHAWYDLICN